MQCINCKDRIEIGDFYKKDVHFDEPVCEDCQADYRQHLIENEAWLDVDEWENQKEIEHTNKKPNLKTKKEPNYRKKKGSQSLKKR